MTIKEIEELVLLFDKVDTLPVSYIKEKGFYPAYIYAALVTKSEPILELRTGQLPIPGDKNEIFWLYASGENIKLRIEKSGLKDNDVLRLTEAGQDILYKLQKENTIYRISKNSKKYAKYSAILGAIGILVSIIIAVLQFNY